MPFFTLPTAITLPKYEPGPMGKAQRRRLLFYAKTIIPVTIIVAVLQELLAIVVTAQPIGGMSNTTGSTSVSGVAMFLLGAGASSFMMEELSELAAYYRQDITARQWGRVIARFAALPAIGTACFVGLLFVSFALIHLNLAFAPVISALAIVAGTVLSLTIVELVISTLTTSLAMFPLAEARTTQSDVPN